MICIKKLLCLVIYFLTLDSLNAQNLVGSAGSTIKENGFVIEYAIGEISINTLSSNGNNWFVTQGLLQPALKVNNPACEIVNDILQFFPNPTRNKIRIVGRNDWISHYIIYAADGKLMAMQPFVNNYIDLTRLAAGYYIIRLLPGCDGQFKTLKIVKQ